MFYQLDHAHDHHGHSHEEPPSFKYSKQANQPPPAPKVKPAEQHHGHSHSPSEKAKPVVSEPKRSTVALWTEALGSTLLISIAPFVILFFIPIDTTPERQPLLKVLLSFASGGLFTDIQLSLHNKFQLIGFVLSFRLAW